MTVQLVVLEAGDAVELGELLEFLCSGLDRDGDRLAGSFGRFVGEEGYDVSELSRDLSRFVFLLGGNDGEMLFGWDER